MRGPSVRACIKRLKSITLDELKQLSNRDLTNLMRIGELVNPEHASIELAKRMIKNNSNYTPAQETNHVLSEHDQAR